MPHRLSSMRRGQIIHLSYQLLAQARYPKAGFGESYRFAAISRRSGLINSIRLLEVDQQRLEM